MLTRFSSKLATSGLVALGLVATAAGTTITIAQPVGGSSHGLGTNLPVNVTIEYPPYQLTKPNHVLCELKGSGGTSIGWGGPTSGSPDTFTPSPTTITTNIGTPPVLCTFEASAIYVPKTGPRQWLATKSVGNITVYP